MGKSCTKAKEHFEKLKESYSWKKSMRTLELCVESSMVEIWKKKKACLKFKEGLWKLERRNYKRWKTENKRDFPQTKKTCWRSHHAKPINVFKKRNRAQEILFRKTKAKDIISAAFLSYQKRIQSTFLPTKRWRNPRMTWTRSGFSWNRNERTQKKSKTSGKLRYFGQDRFWTCDHTKQNCSRQVL